MSHPSDAARVGVTLRRILFLGGFVVALWLLTSVGTAHAATGIRPLDDGPSTNTTLPLLTAAAAPADTAARRRHTDAAPSAESIKVAPVTGRVTRRVHAVTAALPATPVDPAVATTTAAAQDALQVTARTAHRLVTQPTRPLAALKPVVAHAATFPPTRPATGPATLPELPSDLHDATQPTSHPQPTRDARPRHPDRNAASPIRTVSGHTGAPATARPVRGQGTVPAAMSGSVPVPAPAPAPVPGGTVGGTAGQAGGHGTDGAYLTSASAFTMTAATQARTYSRQHFSPCPAPAPGCTPD